MKIEEFIEARLVMLESAVRYNQMNMNGIDIGGELRRDALATRRVLEIVARMEAYAPDTGMAPEVLQFVREMRRIIADRWSDHKDFNPEWGL